MKITVRDVTNDEVNVRRYMSYDEETGKIYVDWEHLDTVLIDKTEEWEELSVAYNNAQKEIATLKSEIRRLKNVK